MPPNSSENNTCLICSSVTHRCEKRNPFHIGVLSSQDHLFESTDYSQFQTALRRFPTAGTADIDRPKGMVIRRCRGGPQFFHGVAYSYSTAFSCSDRGALHIRDRNRECSSTVHSRSHRQEWLPLASWSYPSPTLGQCPLCQYSRTLVDVLGMGEEVWWVWCRTTLLESKEHQAM